jgi:small conductance mechanosensitive channel
MNIDFSELLNNFVQNAGAFSLRILAALAIFVIGRWLAGLLTRALRAVMEKRGVDVALHSFVTGLLFWALIAFVLVAAMSAVGIETTSFVAALGAAGLAVGLALQGALSNFAAGVLIIMFRPFRIGDYVEAGGTAGVVKEITILTTVMATPDNKKIIVPNSAVMSGTITNYSAHDTRRLDLVFGVSYEDDVRKVQQVLQDIVAADPRCLREPAPTIAVLAHADSSINFAVRPWVKKEDYWAVYFDLHKAVKLRFDEEGITIPFPQRDVHLFPAPAVAEAKPA